MTININKNEIKNYTQEPLKFLGFVKEAMLIAQKNGAIKNEFKCDNSESHLEFIKASGKIVSVFWHDYLDIVEVSSDNKSTSYKIKDLDDNIQMLLNTIVGYLM